MSKLSKRKANRSEVPGPLTSTQKVDAFDGSDGSSEEEAEKYVARGRRPPRDRDEELFQRQLDDAIRASEEQAAGQHRHRPAVKEEDEEQPKAGPSGLQAGMRRAAASAAAARMTKAEDNSKDDDDDELLPVKTSAKKKLPSDVSKATGAAATAETAVGVKTTEKQTTEANACESVPTPPITVKINLSKLKMTEDGKPEVRTSKRTPAPSRKKRFMDVDSDDSSDDEFALPSNKKKAAPVSKNKKNATKVSPPSKLDDKTADAAKRMPSARKKKTLAGNDGGDSDDGESLGGQPQKKTRTCAAAKDVAKTNTGVDASSDEDFEPSPDSSDDEFALPSNKKKSEAAVSNNKKSAAKVSPKAKVDDKTADPLPSKRLSSARKKKTLAVEDDSDDGESFGGPPQKKTRTCAAAKNRAKSSTAADESSDEDFEPPDSSDDEFALPTSKKAPPPSNKKSAKVPVKTAPNSSSSSKYKKAVEQFDQENPKKNSANNPASKSNTTKASSGAKNENAVVARSFSAPLAPNSSLVAASCRTVLTPKWKPPAMLSKSVSTPATPSGSPPTPLIGMRVGLSRNFKAKPLHANVKWNMP